LQSIKIGFHTPLSQEVFSNRLFELDFTCKSFQECTYNPCWTYLHIQSEGSQMLKRRKGARYEVQVMVELKVDKAGAGSDAAEPAYEERPRNYKRCVWWVWWVERY
jgi:hypothetical protein